METITKPAGFGRYTEAKYRRFRRWLDTPHGKNVYGMFTRFAEMFGSAVIPVMRGIAVGAAYVWDTFKAGQGIVGVVIGEITKVLGYVVDGFASLIGLAKELPDSLRPDWLDSFIKGTEETAETLKQVGRETSKWGRDRVASFGESADAARKLFDEMEKGRSNEIAKRKKLLENPGGVAPASKPVDYKPIDAALKGSREAAQIEARFYADAVSPWSMTG